MGHLRGGPNTRTPSKTSVPSPTYAGMEVLTPAPPALGRRTPTEGAAAKPKHWCTTNKQTQLSTAQLTHPKKIHRTSTPAPPHATQDVTKTYERPTPSRKVAGRFVAILYPATASSGEEDNLSTPGTDDESGCTETARAAEESTGSGSESDGKVSVKNKKTTLGGERAYTKELEWRFRAARSFPPYEGNGGRYREQRCEKKEDNERLFAGLRALCGRERRGVDRKIREQGNLVLTKPRQRKGQMEPVRAPEGNCDKERCCSLREYDRGN